MSQRSPSTLSSLRSIRVGKSSFSVSFIIEVPKKNVYLNQDFYYFTLNVWLFFCFGAPTHTAGAYVFLSPLKRPGFCHWGEQSGSFPYYHHLEVRDWCSAMFLVIFSILKCHFCYRCSYTLKRKMVSVDVGWLLFFFDSKQWKKRAPCVFLMDM